MNKSSSDLTFGRYLHAARIERGTELEKVAAATRISVDMLRFIEAEDYAKLPAAVFVKGFLRAFAAEVGADGDTAVASYMSGCQKRPAAESLKMDPDGRRLNFWGRLLLAFLGLGAIIGASLWLIPSGAAPVATAPEKSAEVPKVYPALRAGDTTPSAGAPPVDANEGVTQRVAAPPAASAELLRLDIAATEATWLKMIVDDHPPRHWTLKAGDRLEFKARSGFNLLVGNAAGVRLTLNGETVAVSGRSGQVVTLKLP